MRFAAARRPAARATCRCGAAALLLQPLRPCSRPRTTPGTLVANGSLMLSILTIGTGPLPVALSAVAVAPLLARHGLREAVSVSGQARRLHKPCCGGTRPCRADIEGFCSPHVLAGPDRAAVLLVSQLPASSSEEQLTAALAALLCAGGRMFAPGAQRTWRALSRRPPSQLVELPRIAAGQAGCCRAGCCKLMPRAAWLRQLLCRRQQEQ